MKIIITLLLSSFVLVSSCQDVIKKDQYNEILPLGMSKEDAKSVMATDGWDEQNDILICHKTYFDIDARWSYRFGDNGLDRIHFDYYDSEIQKENFDKNLATTERILDEYTKRYGAPDFLEKDNMAFRDPFEDRHWGYDVIEAVWNDIDGMQLTLDFDFNGGKGMYDFMIKIVGEPKKD